MSITSYSELQTAAANWLGRSDLTSRITEGISLAEAKMNRYLRTHQMISKNATFSITGEYVSTPASFGGVKTFYLNTSPATVIDFMPDELMTAKWGSNTTGPPEAYNVQGANFRFGPVPDATYSATLVYWLLVPVLSGSNTTNWVITSHPDVYLYGTLAEMCALAKDFQTAQAYEAMFYKTMDEIRLQSNRGGYAGDGAVFARPG